VGEVDASVHASVEDRREPEPSQSAREVPTVTSSHSAFRPPAQPSATLFGSAKSAFRPAEVSPDIQGAAPPAAPGNLTFHPGAQAPTFSVWPVRAFDAVPDPEGKSDGAVQTVDRWRGLRGSFSTDYRRGDSSGLSPLKTTIQPFPSQPQAEGFSGPFHGDLFGRNSEISPLNPFQTAIAIPRRNAPKAKQGKSRAKKQPERGRAPWQTSVP
jgi:hypothetical protein